MTFVRCVTHEELRAKRREKHMVTVESIKAIAGADDGRAILREAGLRCRGSWATSMAHFRNYRYDRIA